MRISIFLKLIFSQIYRDFPGIFDFFALTYLEIHIFSQFLVYPPWYSKDFYSTPLEFTIDIHNRGVRILSM